MPAEPFAVDVSIPCPTTGGSIMYHVRAETAGEFAARVAAVVALVPALRAVPELQTAGAPPLVAPAPAVTHAPAAPTAPRRQTWGEPGPVPVCPESGRSSWSKHYAGLYCTAKHAGERCNWQHRCTTSCTHAARAA